MLVLKRRKNQKVLFPNLGITVEIVGVSGKSVRLGIDAPNDVRIVRNELECFNAAPAIDNDLARRQLDAANLAIHLARNQLQQGLTELAEQAMQQALTCLESLDQSFALPNKEEISPDLAVHESRAGYATKPAPMGLVLEGNWQQRSMLAVRLRRRDLQVLCPDDSLEAVSFLLTKEQPGFLLMINDDLIAADRSLVGLGDQLGGLHLQGESMDVAGQMCAAWVAPGFAFENLLQA